LKRYRNILISISLMMFLVPVLFSGGSQAAPTSVSGSIELNDMWPYFPEDEGQETIEIVGSFTISEKSLQDAPFPVTATVTLSPGQWEASLRQSVYEIEETGTWERFYIDVTIPEGVKTGESSSYAVSIHFQGRFSDSSAQAGFTVKIESGSMDDDISDDDDDDGNSEGDLQNTGSFPIWPIFLLILIIALIIAGIWAYRNIEVVREVDGKRKIYLREKDTGRILGRDR
jgi:hypothetical protein